MSGKSEKGIEEKKNKFMMEQFFLASWKAALSHNHFWEEGINYNQKRNFRIEVYRTVKEIIESYKILKEVSSELHQKNIDKLKKLHPENGSELGIGKAQKILNIMCKYCWCCGWIPEPPHPVIDRQIIARCSKDELKKISWPQMSDKEYNDIIADLEKVCACENKTPAKWELENWRSSLD